MSLLLNLFSPSAMMVLAIKSVAVMFIALAAATLLYRASAAWRHLVWSLGVASLLLLPAFSLSLPAWRVSWIPRSERPERSGAEQLPLASSVTDVTEPATAIASVDAQVPPAPAMPHAADMAATQPTARPIEPASSPGAPFPWLAAAWFVGALVSLVPLLVGLWRLDRLRCRSQPLNDRRWLSLLDELRRRLLIRRGVRLRQSEAAVAPLTWGAFRPVLLVPAKANDWPDGRRRLVLLHELAHIRRWDWLTQAVAHVVCALYWFNPLVWLAARRMRMERERACDDMVLASGARASDYAHELLTLAAELSDVRLLTLTAVPMTRRSFVEDRIRGILDNRRNRAALTTAAVCVAASAAAAGLAPLAMLRAAPPDPSQQTAEQGTPTAGKSESEKSPVDKSTARDLMPSEIEGRANGIRISVLSATGERSIAEFRVIAGTPSGSVTRDFEKRTGRTVVNWQPHTCRIGKEGELVWPLARAYDEFSLRVEADGYAPQVVTGVKKVNGAQHIVFRLAEDKGQGGRALTPEGQPAAGATVALAQKDIVWEGGKLRRQDDPLPDHPGDRWRRPLFVKTDAEGRFRLPTEVEPAAILVVHESGVRELVYDAWQKAPELTLQPWSKITGQVLWGPKPGADEELTLSAYRDEYGYPGMIASYVRTKTDNLGRFTFDRVLPGKVQISRVFKPANPPNSSGIGLNVMVQHVKLAPGETMSVLLGGQGRKVTGKLIGLNSWEGVTYHCHPEAPHIGLPGDNELWQAFGQLKQSPIGPLLFREKQPVGKDGSLSIVGMLPGRYQLFVSAPGFTNYAAITQFTVEAEVPGQEPPALDLGEIAVKRPVPTASPDGTAAKPSAEGPAKVAAKTVTIRGKAVDDETGKPIGRLITQAGKFDPADPTKVTWGYSEGRSTATDGSFSTSVRWAEGWTARILANGYIPQPVLTSAPPPDKDEIEVTIRLKRGPTVKGVVLDHEGLPVKDAAVFAIGPTGLNLAAGKDWSSLGSEESQARTNADGRFELTMGEAKSLAISHADFDAWPAAIPANGEVTIRLPQPGRVDVELNIDGANSESAIFYQLLSHDMAGFAGLQSSRELKLANPGKLSLTALPPGKYLICRNVMSRLGDMGFGAMLDRQFFELKAGETKTIALVREKGARIRGKATKPADRALMGIVISVRSVAAQKSPFEKNAWPITYASQAAAEDGSFLTERIPPGTYLLVAEGYTPLTPEQRFRSGMIGPSLRAQVKVEVPAEGELTAPDLVLAPVRPDG